jgi:DNA-binding NarL/FixJ family response regulator
VAAAEGELGVALAAGEELLGAARRMGPSLTDATAGWILGEVLLEAGQPTRCVTSVPETLGRAGATAGGSAVHAWHGLARAEVQRGRHGEAQAWIDRADAVLPGLAPLQYPRALAERARAEVLLAAGEAAAAARAALAAADAADRIHARPEAGRARLLAGRALGAAGERERAIQLLEQARAELDDCGAQRFREEAERELRRLGRRISRGGGRRPASTAGRAALSDRERQVAELAAGGRTNQAIADELFLSIKTVERHMSNIFRKLGVCSRAQIGTTLQTLE